MIQHAYIENWRQKCPWQFDFMVEQDLILSKALVDIYDDALIRNNMFFRGGTALNKLFFEEPYRYSEDIDLSRMTRGGIGKEIDIIRAKLDPWLGNPKRDFTPQSVKIIYRYSSINGTTQRLKIEINIEEQRCFLGKKEKELIVESPWFFGKSLVTTFYLEELMATKLRALYQRKKGRDLFDIYYALTNKNFNIEKVLYLFDRYMSVTGKKISKKDFLDNLEEKRKENIFMKDIEALLPSYISESFDKVYKSVVDNIIGKM